MSRFRFCTLALALLVSTSASAHGLWTEQRRGNTEVVFGEGAEDDAYDAASVKAGWAWTAEGKGVPLTVERLADHARLKAATPAALTAVEFDAGVWTQAADGQWANKPRAEVKNPKQSIRATKYSLAIHQPYQQLPALDSWGLVIVPEVDPGTLRPGQALPVRVLAAGKPVAGLAVYADYRGAPGAMSEKTDAEGRVKVTIRNEGLNVLAAESSTPGKAGGPVDTEHYFASLTFVGAPHAE